MPEWVEIVVPESEKEVYAEAVSNPIITTPDNIIGLGMLRNWCLDNFPERSVIMLDDDIMTFYCLTELHARKIDDKEEFIQILINTCVMARDAGAKVFGFFQTDIRKYKGTEPFSLKAWIGTIIGINDRKYRFRNDAFKVDIDYCLQALLVDRIIWMDCRYYAVNVKDKNGGGNGSFRTQDSFNRSVKTLQDKWGSCLKIKSKGVQLRVTLNFARKQPIELN